VLLVPPTSASHTVVAAAATIQTALRAPGVPRTSALLMAVEVGASILGAPRAPVVPLTSAKHTAEAGDAHTLIAARGLVVRVTVALHTAEKTCNKKLLRRQPHRPSILPGEGARTTVREITRTTWTRTMLELRHPPITKMREAAMTTTRP
jgi:hypothetical protein